MLHYVWSPILNHVTWKTEIRLSQPWSKLKTQQNKAINSNFFVAASRQDGHNGPILLTWVQMYLSKKVTSDLTSKIHYNPRGNNLNNLCRGWLYNIQCHKLNYQRPRDYGFWRDFQVFFTHIELMGRANSDHSDII